MKRALPLALFALVCTPTARAQTMVLLPSLRPTVPSVLTAVPSTATSEVRWPRQIHSSERVVVDVDAAGRPLIVHVVQRLVVQGLGDYTFVVAAPVADVRRAAGSQSEPGLRHNAVVWAGFSPRRRLLAADLFLRREASVFAGLPLRVSFKREGGSVRLVLANATADRVQTFAARAAPREVQQAFALLRQDLALGPSAPDRYLDVRGRPRSVVLDVAAPLQVRGVFFLGGKAAVRFSRMLGDDRPLRAEVAVPRATDALRIRIIATPVLPQRLLTGPRTVDQLVRARLTIARATQYGAFVAAPDPRGEAHAVYVYRTATRAHETPRRDENGGRGIPAVAWVLLGVLGAAGLAVLWAHS